MVPASKNHNCCVFMGVDALASGEGMAWEIVAMVISLLSTGVKIM
jgi:hypothetical protein